MERRSRRVDPRTPDGPVVASRNRVNYDDQWSPSGARYFVDRHPSDQDGYEVEVVPVVCATEGPAYQENDI